MEKGILVRWKNDKGFGFIEPETANGKDVFIHISELKHMARKPMVGDSIEYRAQQQADGKIKAINASIEGVAVISASTTPRRASNANQSKSSQRRSKSSSIILIPLLIILGLGVFGFKRYEALSEQSNAPIQVTHELHQEPTAEQIQWTQPKESFRCESGKQYCSQMRSCAEANFYNNNCPGTKMDGDGDGIPCEKQHCGY
ncbi:excalibur calcium-binding domain-containing protein [Shewanella benthica]|uniref:excalibur calcium-binding domain-containing protein n=1 Tax=Shewanella benthica TaxID=43661 RepID=UPI00187A652F|nr:excalibur calcium-binding domain-containing protein [Shewanella benthica]MBE7214174.1 excalibur calcium-binding domain-containing protein [Shewanella benthica]MCL1061417.1 excalibur calcium-binding domain-containing protein [Shewanella benthica]